MSRRLLPGLLALVVLAGCAAPLPEPSPDPVPATPEPALDVAQVERILTDLRGVLDAADEAQDPALLDDRVTGPARTMRTAEYRLAEDGSLEGITPIPTEVQTVVVPATTEWPRVVMAVTEPPEDLLPPLVVALVQTEPRDPYRLWGWARLFPGVEVPPSYDPSVGTVPIPSDTADLLLRPADVTPAYVDLLGSGDESEHAGTFSEDPLRSGIVSTRAAFTEAVGENGDLTETYEVLRGAPPSVATADGGAVVLNSFVTETTITLDDSTLTIGDETAELLGSDTVEENLTLTYLSTVVFHVPPAGSEDAVTVIGAEHLRTGATGE